MNEKINALLNGLSPELQEKAKDIKTQEELMEFLSDNDVELPEDALESVSGGCSVENEYPQGTVFENSCPDCGGDLIYHDNTYYWARSVPRAHCAKTGVLYYYFNRVRGGASWKRYEG